ncbi:MAG: hypothetical protein AAF799_41445 [Myxococcota bacterium]
MDAEKVLSDAERSGLDDREYAKRHGLDPQRLWCWRKRLGRPRSESGDTPTFVEVQATSQPPALPQMVEVWLANGRSVVVPMSMDTTRLTELLDAIDGPRC